MKKLCLLLSLLGTLGAMDPLGFRAIENMQDASGFQFAVTITGGQPGFTYRLSDASGLLQTIESNDRSVLFDPRGNPSEIREHTVSVRDASGETISLSFPVNPLNEPAVIGLEVLQDNTAVDPLVPNGILHITTRNAPGNPSSFLDVFIGDSEVRTFPVTNNEVTIGNLGRGTSAANVILNYRLALPFVFWGGNIPLNYNPLSFNSTVTPDTGGGSGTITVNATSGIAPYQYQLNDQSPQASNEFENLIGGTYTVTVTDSSQTVNVSEQVVPDPQTISQDVVVPPLFTIGDIVTTPDTGMDNGTVTVMIEAGLGLQTPYNYTLRGDLVTKVMSANETSYTFMGVPADTYEVVVTDSSTPPFSTQTQRGVVVENAGIDITSIETTPDNGTGNGTVTVTIETGEAVQSPFTYRLDGEEASNITAETYTFMAVSAGTYEVVVTDSSSPPAMVSGEALVPRTGMPPLSSIGEFIQSKYCS